MYGFVKLVFISLFTFLFTVSALATEAANDAVFPKLEKLRLGFNLQVSKDGDVRFPKGYPYPGPMTTEQEAYKLLNVQVDVIAKILNSTTVRFTFTKPKIVETRNKDGQDVPVVLRFLDIKLKRQDMQNFNWMQSLDSETVLVERASPEEFTQSFEEILEQSPSETLKRRMEKWQSLASLYVFDGSLDLGYVDFERVQSGQPIEAQVNRVNLIKVLRFNPDRMLVTVDQKQVTSAWLEQARSFAHVGIFDPRIAKFLEVQEYVKAAVLRASPFLGTRVVDGQQQIVLFGPEKNVLELPISTKNMSCEFVFTKLN